MKTIRGIKGVEGYDPIQFAASLGLRLTANGPPREKDRIHLVYPRDQGGIRPHHASFREWNVLPPKDHQSYLKELDRRQLIHCNLVHSTEEECFQWKLSAQVLGKPHPVPPGRRRPACTGNGVKAIRFVGPGPDDFKEIRCPNEKCEFRQKREGEPTPCGPWMRLIFRINWVDPKCPMPKLIGKFSSGGWETTNNAVGFFKRIKEIAQGIGIQKPNLMGLPFTMARIDVKKPGQGFKYPVMTFGFDEDIVGFLQQSQLRQLPPGEVVPAIEDLSDSLTQDMADVRPGFGSR